MPNVLFLLLLFAQKPPSVSFVAPVDPAVAAKTHDQLAASLSPSAKSKLQNVVTTIRTSSSITDSAARTAVTSAFPGVSGPDAQALVFLAMMEASNGAQQDLSNITSEVDKMNAQKSALQPKLATTDSRSPSVAKVILQSHPVDYYRAPDPLPESASQADIEKRIHDLDAMTDANRLRTQALKNQQQQMLTVVSSTFKAAQAVAPNAFKDLK